MYGYYYQIHYMYRKNKLISQEIDLFYSDDIYFMTFENIFRLTAPWVITQYKKRMGSLGYHLRILGILPLPLSKK